MAGSWRSAVKSVLKGFANEVSVCRVNGYARGVPVITLVLDIISASLLYLIRQLMQVHASVYEDPWDKFTHFLHASGLGS